MDIVLRPATTEDLPFIYSSCLSGIYHGHPFYKSIDKDVFYDTYRAALKVVLSRSNILVACLADEADVALGYCIYEKSTVHWIYVKGAFRKHGIGKRLWPSGITTVSHLSKPGDYLRKKMNLKFNPFV